MAYVVPPPSIPGIPVIGTSDLFPVRRIYCVGRNYAAHAREMGGDPDREPPFFFAKPSDAVVVAADPKNPVRIPYPPATKNLHHEMELVVAIGTGGANISVEKALDHVYGYAAGLDMTRRDLQNAARDKGRPWDMGKGFDQSAPIGHLYRATQIGHPAAGEIKLDVSGKTKQHADLKELIWNVPETIAYLSGLVTLGPGDLIYTGTPEGVGPVVAGDTLIGTVETCGTVAITYV
ncbi:fumarylacetoacetate hydrolase family protein [Reyranella sp. CPCC 100927]|uniref:fumarylacetoacetate hydrolase family protein n=1 Tax=Reyranella sp. CPCC 100927 TaxID=2599616 RepID=UPI0011B46F0A|nr:fumarylacetoacetate hydrolase family protein [Reyranella sp. CPCC 100927]TWS96584.1 fumarylacetoacetate hydrolase family protein [Reyranella sp. CPCC 100927]